MLRSVGNICGFAASRFRLFDRGGASSFASLSGRFAADTMGA